MLFSSFSNGVLPSPRARRALRMGLVGAILRQRQMELEGQLERSALHSPCSGPDAQVLSRLEVVDRALEGLVLAAGAGGSDDERIAASDLAADTVGSILEECFSQPTTRTSTKSAQGGLLSVRVVYVPTAMYALRKDSTSTAGKQRQRARSDAKKRRDEVCGLISDLLSFGDSGHRTSRKAISIDAVTLDWADGSLKHVACTGSPPPSNGRQALAGWRPHLVYVQGGNTFWLHHCVEKGGWSRVLADALRDGSAYYCGSSAGAIVAGASMDPASWKEWDDCTVVPDPSRSRYQDWRDVPGMGLVGRHSFFPHMSDAWQTLVDQKQSERVSGGTNGDWRVVCMRDKDVCLVDGFAETLTTLSSSVTANVVQEVRVAAV
jgi:hypothetical protein